MYPWFWWWAPQLHFPFSGSVAQRIEPDTRWFFAGIEPQAGNGELERLIHEDIASYGRQLGLITEVLLSLTGRGTMTPTQAQESLDRLEEIQRKVDALKGARKERLRENAEEALRKLFESEPDAVAPLVQRFAARQRLLGHDQED